MRSRGLTSPRTSWRTRRGSTLPLVCILLTAIIGAAAMAVDLGRLYYTGAEVQTAADAAALAAARFQQYTPTSGLAGVRSAAQQVAAMNLAGGQAAQVLSQDVVPVTYDPATRAIGATSGWSSTTAAFTITAQAAVPAILGGVGRTVRRSATAWIANVNGGTCVRPVGINYTRFYEEGVTHDTRYSANGAYAPDFNLWDIGSTKDASLPGRTFIVVPPGVRKDSLLAKKRLNSHANWQPVDYTGGGYYAFGYALGGPEGSSYCSGNRATVGDVKNPLIGDSATIIYAANQAMITLCNRTGNAANAFCYNSDGSIGVKTRIMLTDSVPVNGAWKLKVREIGVARVMCYFQSSSDICAYTQMSEIAANGTWCYYSRGACPNSDSGSLTGYPAGTMMVFLDTPGSTAITRDITLGTKPALTQRVLLAK